MAAKKKMSKKGMKHEMMEGSKERKMEYGSAKGGMKKAKKK
jgi:hypothetical protein